jgi:uncharacterized protein YfaP (DUF2135 family)
LAGNQATKTLAVTRDTELHYTISSPRNGQKTAKKSINVSGTTEPNSTVTVQGGAIRVQADGSFFSEIFLTEGKNIISVTVRDAAGNAGQSVITVERTKPAPQGIFIPGLDSLAVIGALFMMIIIQPILKYIRRN